MTETRRKAIASNAAFDLLNDTLKSDRYSYTIKLAGKTFEFTTVQNMLKFAEERGSNNYPSGNSISKGWLGRSLHSVISEETDYHIGSISQDGNNVTAYFKIS